MPILYQDRLVARVDLKLERETKALVVKGFWLEEHLILDDAFLLALTRGFQRFMQFVGMACQQACLPLLFHQSFKNVQESAPIQQALNEHWDVVL